MHDRTKLHHTHTLLCLQARENLAIPWASGEHGEAASAGRALERNFTETRAMRRERARLAQLLWTVDEFLQLVPLMEAIWADASIRDAFDQRSKLITENFVRYGWCVEGFGWVWFGVCKLYVVMGLVACMYVNTPEVKRSYSTSLSTPISTFM